MAGVAKRYRALVESRSPHIGVYLYDYDDLLEKSGVANAKYYKFIYAMWTMSLPAVFLLLPLVALKEVWSRESNFMGYVAMATDWRGTVRPIDWTKELDVTPVLDPAASTNPLTLVHHRFMSLYTSNNADSKFNKTTSAMDQALEEVRRLMKLYKDEETSITVTGHRLGAALTTPNVIDMVPTYGVNTPARQNLFNS